MSARSPEQLNAMLWDEPCRIYKREDSLCWFNEAAQWGREQERPTQTYREALARVAELESELAVFTHDQDKCTCRDCFDNLSNGRTNPFKQPSHDPWIEGFRAGFRDGFKEARGTVGAEKA